MKLQLSKIRQGFTLIEIMVVLLILALLSSIVAPRVTKHLRKAKLDAAVLQVAALSSAVDSFLMDTGRLPTNEEGLKILYERPSSLNKWDGPYVTKKSSLVDPWNTPYFYRTPGRNGDYEVLSFGPDKKESKTDDSDDIGNW